MANKIRICPVCKTWTSENRNTCEICGQDLILTKYTDLFFNKLSQEEQFEHVQEVIDGNRDGSNNQNIINTHVVTTSELTNWLGKTLQIIGAILIGLGFIAGLIFGNDQYGDISLRIFMIYFIAGLISGIIIIGFGEIINLLFSIDKKLDKK